MAAILSLLIFGYNILSRLRLDVDMQTFCRHLQISGRKIRQRKNETDHEQTKSINNELNITVTVYQKNVF